MSGEISQEQIQQFHEQGYLILPAVFTDKEVQKMKEESDYILEMIINSSIYNQRVSGRLDWFENDEGQQSVRKIQPVNDLSLLLTEISADDRFLQPMRQIMNDEPLLMEEKLNYKQPLSQRVADLKPRKGTTRFPIHNDWAYYATQNYPQDIISSAISIDSCTPDNGPLHIWPGSHNVHLEHVKVPVGLEVKPGLIDADGGIDVLVPPGSVMLFHSLLIHNSRENSTSQPRRLMIYSHYPKNFPMCFDVRNGPTRLRESPWERLYLRMKEQGVYVDTFHAD